jgi:hypothetical protein
MALAALTVATSIAGLSVSGVYLKDVDAIPERVEVRDCPIIYPKPDGFLSDLEVEINSFGSAQAKKTVRYNLNYVFLQSPVGAGRGLFDVYESCVTNALAFVDALLANDALSGSVDIQPAGITSFGPVADPSGNMFHGCVFSLAVMEFVG